MGLVSVQYEFEYTAKNGRLVSIKPNERYILVSKTSQHWWHVRRDPTSSPFFVPAQYVVECVTPDMTLCKATPVIRVPAHDASRETYRFSTFGFCNSLPEVKTPHAGLSGSFVPTPDNLQEVSAGSFSSTSAPLPTDGLQLLPEPPPLPKAEEEPPEPPELPEPPESPEPPEPPSPRLADRDEKWLEDNEDVSFPSPPPSNIYNTIPELYPELFPELEPELDSLSDPLVSSDLSASEQQSLSPSAPEAPLTEQVENESLRSAVYVNVAQLRQSISESPPSAPSSYSPSYLDPEGWEVHVDQESGQEYYYHPSTGQTTWDKPFLDSPTDPEHLPAEDPYYPTPPQSPALSPSTSSPPAWISDWERLVDETSGRPYFYNAMSGETSWEPPELLSPYPPLMEPMSVHRFHEEGPPPLPEEDYPPEDYPSAAEQTEVYKELLATGPPTLPKEYTLSHMSRTSIPRATLDRSTPIGWNLNVESNGTWVFTSDLSPDQWIKSVDERGQTYYYLRDGSRSQWNLPEAPVAPGHSRVENGVEVENVSVIKNWRHTMGPAQLSSPQDEVRFVPTHRRNTSDYSSDSSSTGNSPETQHNVQNLEKAGILNKTKVSENGKKVRKNWGQTWTVLHGGVLTFHKDPKSAVTGGSSKTNQIVPEVTVDLRGATIGWASKDKSSKKNVLELKGKNGVEFLIQYDTESIISDWHKVLVDTIRQLEYQDHHSEEEDENLYEKIAEREDKSSGAALDKRRPSKPGVTHSSSSAGENDQKRVRTKLMKFLLKRPTLQSVKEKGYIRDNVFGCHLSTLCAQERTTVPGFVERCIKAVEKRGLEIDGLYRVSGNLAVIQKLRFKADHEELDLEDGQWEDVHVITGALKLFFRELPEPLFPFSHFENFITAIRIPDHNQKVSCMRDLVKSLPLPNHDTMEMLFGHLRRVIQFWEKNRMSVQNVAIVFGPTLLRPEMEASNIALHMVYQNQIVEFVLNEYERIFHSS